MLVLLNELPVGRLYVSRCEKEIRIIDISLLPQYRRAGIGSLLLNDILAESVNTDRPVAIHVEQFNPAMRLYERLGFKRAGEVGVYFRMEWIPVRSFDHASPAPEPSP